MVAFPEKTGRERKEGPYRGQNPRGAGKRIVEGADPEHRKGALGGPHEGRTGDLPVKPSCQGQWLLHP